MSYLDNYVSTIMHREGTYSYLNNECDFSYFITSIYFSITFCKVYNLISKTQTLFNIFYKKNHGDKLLTVYYLIHNPIGIVLLI